MEYRLQSMYNHMVGRTASVISPFYSLLPGPDLEHLDELVEFRVPEPEHLDGGFDSRGAVRINPD